jgi:hypothetical protein
MTAAELKAKLHELIIEEAEAKRDAALFRREQAQIERDVAAFIAAQTTRLVNRDKKRRGGSGD